MKENHLLHTRVISLKCWLNYTFAGIGGWLFTYKDKILMSSSQIFIGSNIHGMYIVENLFVIYGGKQIAFQKGSNFESYSFTIIDINDWIKAVCNIGDYLTVALAHNVMELWNMTTQKQVATSKCVEKCILYSCHVLGPTLSNIIFLSGTVFSEVIVWSPSCDTSEDQPVLQRICGHKGVIFSINVSHDWKTMCTTSDDRSLCVWHIDSPVINKGVEFWKESKVTLAHTLYGHTARVWQSLILDDKFISIGEDSSMCVWSRNGELNEIIQLHQGCGIRVLAASPVTGSVLTGGEDGGITSIQLVKEQSADVLLVGGTTNYPRQVKFVDKNIITITEQGSVLCVHDKTKTHSVVYDNKEFYNYCVIEKSPCGKFIALGSLSGWFTILNTSNWQLCYEARICTDKIFSVHWTMNYLVICSTLGKLHLYSVNNDDQLINLIKMKNFVLPKSKEQWTTCAKVVNDFLIAGDRMGNLFVYKLNDEADQPLQSYKRLHVVSGVSDITIQSNTILTCGRDGAVNHFQVSESGLDMLVSYKAPMSWLWRIVQSEARTLILGFSSVKFLVWSLNEREVLAELDCGGGHRSCDYQLSDSLMLVYVKEKCIHHSQLKLDRFTHVRKSHHGKEINCMAKLSQQPAVLISGSEDTTLRIFSLHGDELSSSHVLTSHISSVRAISVCQMDNKSLIVTAGGRAQLILWMWFAESRTCKEIETHFLHQERKTDWRSEEVFVDPETRYMCLDTVQLDSTRVLIVAGCSDCKIRIFIFNGKLTMIGEIAYHHCILKVFCCCLKDMNLLVSMATDGRIIFWDISSVLKGSIPETPLASYSAHQSGINSFDWKLLGNCLLLATGGDDNLLCIHAFCCDEKTPCLINSWKSSTAHSCQITGIKLLEGVMVSTSIDQRITSWSWGLDDACKLHITMMSQVMTDIADVQGLLILLSDGVPGTEAQVCVYGTGVEVKDIKTVNESS